MTRSQRTLALCSASTGPCACVASPTGTATTCRGLASMSSRRARNGPGLCLHRQRNRSTEDGDFVMTEPTHTEAPASEQPSLLEGVEQPTPGGWGDYPIDELAIRDEPRTAVDVVRRI